SLAADCKSESELTSLLESGKISAAVIIPADFEKELAKNKTASVQTLLDGADAYTANVASGYIRKTMSEFHPEDIAPAKKPLIGMTTNMMYNPGLRASWYLVPGVLGATLTLIGTLVSSAVILREKELGTLEQLLMTPASEWEVILAKVIPLFVLLLSDVAIAIFLCQLIFELPFKGNPFLFFFGAALYISICIGFGMFLGTLCKSQRQAQLCSFFINIPLIQLSGSVVPFESMPIFLQQLSTLDPLRYFTYFARAVLLKGAGIELLWPYLAALAFASILILSASTIRFRRQLA
ncbi:MAG: ABC transporter permease, partial [Candidatus Obscuribacterales bacterium]|nr:ABC transporter permease [Candidatus Obscuribacterales bacterium]